MYSKTETAGRHSESDMVKAKKLVAKIKAAKKDPNFIKAAKAFYKQHTGEELAVSD